MAASSSVSSSVRPPLTSVTDFPYVVKPFPFDWLSQWSGLAPLGGDQPAAEPPANPLRVE